MARHKVVGVKVFWAVALTLLLMAIPAFAQLPTGAILGSVKDTTGASVPGATVTIRNIDTSISRTVTSAQDGTFNVPGLSTGHYEVKAEHEGFKTENRTGITLNVTDQALINFVLEVGSTTQEVVVSGEAPIVNTQDATLGGLVNEQYMQDLPLNGRNYVDLSLLEPGVSQDKNSSGNGATSFSVNGASPRSNNFTLDGAVTVTQEGRNPANGAAGSTLGVDGVKEYKIITSDFPAEYGLASGSQVVVVSKNGTNQFHGDAFEYLRNNVMDARNFFALVNPPLIKNQFGGAFGGPIKKDKTFFFGVFEALRQKLGVTNNLSVPALGCSRPNGTTAVAAGTLLTPLPSATDPLGCPDVESPTVVSPFTAPILAIYPAPNVAAVGNGLNHFTFNTANRVSENYGQMRVDQNLSTADSLFVRYTVDNGVLITPGSIIPQNHTETDVRNQWLSIGENHIFSASVLNTFRLSFSRTDLHTLGVDVIPGPSLIAGQPMGSIGIGGNGSGSGAYTALTAGSVVPTVQVQNIYTLSDDVNWTWGKHSFKFGTLLNRWNEGVQNVSGLIGQLVYGTFQNLVLSQPNLIEFRPPFANGHRFNIFDTLGFYGQDAWRVNQRLTLNLGLRYEFMTVPREIYGRQSRVVNDFTDPFTVGPIIAQNSTHDFSPRIGIAYDLFGNGKTAVRAGGGIYYDVGNIGGALEQDVIGSPPFSGLSDVLTSSNPPVSSYWPVPLPLPANIINTPSDVTPQFIDYQWKSTYQLQYNASVQQQLPWDMGISVGYVGNRGVHLPTIRDSNPIIPTSTGPCGDPASSCVNGMVQFWDQGSPKYHYINPNFPSTINIATKSDSHYNALQIVLNKRTSHGLQFQTSYVRSKVTDDVQGMENVRDCSAGAGIQGTDPLFPSVDNGPACFNIPNNWQFSMVYHFPLKANGSALLKAAANGWWVGSIASILSGEPFSIVTTNNRSNSGVLQGQNDYVNKNTAALIAAHPCTSQPGQPASGSNPCAYTPIPFDANTVLTYGVVNGVVQQYFNPAMFSIAPDFVSPEGGGNTVGQLGNAGRNILQGPPSRDWAFSLVKDTKVGFLGEAGQVEFRAEIFNILNHPDFGEPTATAFAGNQSTKDLGAFSETPGKGAGQITKQQNIPRQIQLALRVEF
jgi:Carboxypeptidase regulatory-like domain/TonB dependent receptor